MTARSFLCLSLSRLLLILAALLALLALPTLVFAALSMFCTQCSEVLAEAGYRDLDHNPLTDAARVKEGIKRLILWVAAIGALAFPVLGFLLLF
jgi:hypothetical protein